MQYYCPGCKKTWTYPVEKCIFCGGKVSEKDDAKYHVTGFTEIHVPSAGNERVPYFVNILEDAEGHKIIRKSFRQYTIGENFLFEQEIRQDLVIGVVGTGLLGIQIAAYMLQYGFPTILKTRHEKSQADALKKIQKILGKRSEAGEVARMISNLTISVAYRELAPCDIIIEAAAEDIGIKTEVFSELSKNCRDDTVFATNSSSLSIDDLAKLIKNPGRCIGMHFFNPVQKMDLVEVVIGSQTSPATKDKVMDLAVRLNKKPILVKNSPGYIVNRLLLPQINEAILILEEGVATKEDIDSAVKLGLNHPMGPFELADFIGLDICQNILEILHKNCKNPKYKPAKLLQTMVSEGKLGYKSGEGFYTYGKK